MAKIRDCSLIIAKSGGGGGVFREGGYNFQKQLIERGTFFCDGKKRGGGGYNAYLWCFHP